MMFDAFDLDPNLSQAEMDQKINDLYVDLLDFSKIACIDGRLFGVKTSCDACDLTLNSCVRNNSLLSLLSAQEKVEAELGYNLTTRYQEEEVPWDGQTVIQTDWPGVEAIDVRLQYSDIEGFGPFEISPYVQLDVPLIDSGDGYCVATLDHTLVDNPGKIIFRDAEGRVHRTQEIDIYPRRNDDGDWEVAMGKTPAAPACGTTLNAQHCLYMYVDTPTIDACEEGQIVPVYPGSNQVIPQAKPRENIEDGWRWWFYVWTLVDSAFAGEEVDLQRGQFYKLLPEIAFKCLTEVEALPIAIWQSWDCETDAFVYTEEELTRSSIIENKKTGMVLLNVGSRDCPVNGGEIVKVRFYYKTNPDFVPVTGALLTLREAITYYAAATLPLSSCKCEIKTGFIAEAQKPYTDVRVNPISGDTIYVLKFGNLYGQLVFGERIADILHHQKLSLL